MSFPHARSQPAVEVQFVWGETVLAAEVLRGRASLASLARRSRVAAVPAELADVVVVCARDGATALGSPARGWVRAREGWVELRAGEFAVRARSVRREDIRRELPRPGALALSVAGAALACAFGLGWTLRAAEQNDATGRRDEALRALVARVSARGTVAAPRAQQPGREAAAPTESTTAAPAEDVNARAALGREGEVLAETAPGARGVLSIAAFAAWAARFRWPDAPAGPRPLPEASVAARAGQFPGLGEVGTGAGAGCADPAHCRTVRGPEMDFSRGRASGARIAAAPVRARVSAAPVLRAPDPPGGEITMEYVRRVVRHDLLASVVRCYDERAQQSTLPGGRVLVRFTIRADGRVVDPMVVSSAVSDPPTHACIARVLRAYVFPATAAGATVSYPFVFSSLAPETG